VTVALSQLQYQPQNGTAVYAPIISAVMTVGLYLNRSLPEGPEIVQYLKDMVSATNGRFWARLSIVGDTQAVFIGNLILSDVIIPNANVGTVKLTFNDGLTELETIDYKDNLGEDFNPSHKATLWEHLTNCLRLLPSRDNYDDSDNFIEVLNSWSHTDQNSVGTNVFKRTRVRYSKFITVNDDGTLEPMKAFDVIVEIVKPYFCTIAYLTNEEGNYLLTQFDTFMSVQIPDRTFYTKTFASGVKLARQNNNLGAKAITGGVFKFIPGLKQVVMNFDYDRSALIADIATNETESLDYVDLISMQLTSENEKIIAWGTLETLWNVSTYSIWGAKAVFNLAVRITRPSDGKQVWWERDSTFPPTSGWTRGITSINPGWTTTESFSTVRSSTIIREKGDGIALNDMFIDIITAPLSEEFNVGDELVVSTKFAFYYRERHVNSPSFIENFYDLEGYERKLYATILEAGDSSNITTSGLQIKGLFNEKNVAEQTYNITLGYGQNASASNLEIQNTNLDWVTATNKWTDTTGEFYLYELVLKKLYRMRASTSEAYAGVWKGPSVWGMKRFTTPGQVLFPLSGTHDIGRGTFQGEFIEPTLTLGSPTIEINPVSNSSSSSSPTSVITASVPNSQGESTQLIKKPFKITGVTGFTLTVTGAKCVSDADYDEAEILLFSEVYRGSVKLIYESGTPGRSEYKMQPQSEDTVITLGKEAKATDVFHGWILLTN